MAAAIKYSGFTWQVPWQKAKTCKGPWKQKPDFIYAEALDVQGDQDNNKKLKKTTINCKQIPAQHNHMQTQSES